MFLSNLWWHASGGGGGHGGGGDRRLRRVYYYRTAEFETPFLRKTRSPELVVDSAFLLVFNSLLQSVTGFRELSEEHTCLEGIGRCYELKKQEHKM